MKRNAAPIIAAVLLLLPVVYVGSYLALVNPQPLPRKSYSWGQRNYGYRIDGLQVARFYWPLEQIDRKVRPGAWEHEGFVPERAITGGVLPDNP